MGSLDSSRDLQSILAKKIENRFYLILQISKILFQNFLAKSSKHNLTIGAKKNGNRQTHRFSPKCTKTNGTSLQLITLFAVWFLQPDNNIFLSHHSSTSHQHQYSEQSNVTS